MTFKDLLERLKRIEPTDPILDGVVMIRDNEGTAALELCATTNDNPCMFFNYALEDE